MSAVQETWVRSLGLEDPLEKEMATHSSILAWRIPWTEEPDGLQSTGSQRVGHNWATSLSASLILEAASGVLAQPVKRLSEMQATWVRSLGLDTEGAACRDAALRSPRLRDNLHTETQDDGRTARSQAVWFTLRGLSADSRRP